MAYRDVPEDEPMEVNYFGEEDNLNVERINQMDAQSNELLPMCDLVKESDLGEVESLERDETDPELERIRSGAFRCIFLRVRLDGSIRALLSGHSMYEALRRTRPNVAQMLEETRLIKTADRIPNICFDIIAPRFMLGPRLHLNEVTYILYENAPLGTLYKHVEGENTRFDDTTILQFACQLATAIEYCHLKLKIMHRNINPKSIFVFQLPTGHFYLKLGGFVFARKVSKEDVLSANMNRMLRFSAPETLQNNAVAFYSYSSDIWSYGMVLDYIAHNGRNPFEGLNHRSRLRRALWESNRRPELRADLHPALGVLIETCCRSEKRDDDGEILPLQVLRPTAVEIRQFLVVHGHQNEEDRLALREVAQLDSVSRPLAELTIESPSRSLERLKEHKTIEFSPTLRRYTVEKTGLTEDQLKVSQHPYEVDGYIIGRIRLVSVEEDYIPFIPELFHKNIVAQYGLLETKNHGYFFMLERTVGTSVQKYLEENKPTEEVTRSWLLDASRALNYCHSLNISYGELSLDRLLVHESELKLEHPAVCKNYGRGVKQDLLELSKLALIFSDDRLKSLSEKIESGTIETASEACRFLEELVPKATFEKEVSSLKRMAPCEEAVSVKAAMRSSPVTTLDPDLQIVPENVEDIYGQKETAIGTLIELDTKHVSSPALVKYLGGRSDLWHQARDHSKFGITNSAVAEAVEFGSCLENSEREREICFAGKEELRLLPPE